MWWLVVGGGEVYYSPVIRSCLLVELCLRTMNHIMLLNVLPSLYVRQDGYSGLVLSNPFLPHGRIEGPGVGNLLLRGQLSSHKTPAG